MVASQARNFMVVLTRRMVPLPLLASATAPSLSSSTTLIAWSPSQAAPTTLVRPLGVIQTFFLQIDMFWKWSRGDSNLRPPPCEGDSVTSPLSASVQKLLQISAFLLNCGRLCSPLFV